MKSLMFVVFLLLHSSRLSAANDSDEPLFARIESEWARIYYTLPTAQREAAFDQLLAKVERWSQASPRRAEWLIWRAIIISTRASVEDEWTALSSIHHAKDLLQQAIALQPDALEGAAFITLGSLYYQVPSWPIAFGDNQKAEEMLQNALRVNPKSLDANYFYGDFLLSQSRAETAIEYFKRVLQLPSRAEQPIADGKIKEAARQGLKKAYAQLGKRYASVSNTASEVLAD